MKYYIYISDAKVDMLLPQIRHPKKKKVASEFGLDLKVLIAKRKIESEIEENRISKLESVLSFIRREENLGTIDSPAEYFEGTLSMQMVMLGIGMVYWGGASGHAVLGLGGSKHHLVGASSYCGELPPNSLASTIMHHLRIGLSQMDGELERRTDKARELDRLNETSDLGTLERFNSTLIGPHEDFSFLAKRLWCSPRNKSFPKLLILGTPLYVAKAD